jgi:hypothetical protein
MICQALKMYDVSVNRYNDSAQSDPTTILCKSL